MDICLHVGAHRTGTTSLQTLLQNRCGQLRRHGVEFWGPARTRSGLLPGLIKNPDYLKQDDVDLGQRSAGRLAMEVDRLEQEGVHKIILSEENMIGTMAENLSSCRLYGQADARLARFLPAFNGRSLQILLSIRSYDTHWASQLAYRIKAGTIIPHRSDIDLLAMQMRDWQSVVRSLARALPSAQILVWRFEDWVMQPAALLKTVFSSGIGLNDAACGERCNASDSATALAELVLQRGDASGAKHLAANNDGVRYMPFSARQQADLQHLYRDDLDWLRTGADGLATYLSPAEGTFGGYDMTKGSPHERQKTSVASPR